MFSASGAPPLDARSTRELVRALREDAEAVLRGVDALQERFLKEDVIPEPPVASGWCCPHQPAPEASGGPPVLLQKKQVRLNAELEAAPSAPGATAPGAGASSPRSLAADRRKSITSWLQVPPALASRWRRQSSDLGPPVTKSQPTKTFGGAGPNSLFQLDSRWRDLFVSNELEMEADDESVLSGLGQPPPERKSLRRSVDAEYPGGVSLRPLCDKRGNAPLRPHDRIRITWDVIGLIFMLYDFVTIPVFACWGIQPSGWSFAMVGITAAFWSMDIIMNFNTGFFSGGVLVMSRRAVWEHYMKTWFFLDIVVALLDYILLAGFGSALSGARAIRVLRLARVAKISKLNQAIEDVCASFGIRWVILVIAILRNLAFIFALAHLAACGWYYIGRTRKDQKLPGWLNVVDPDETTPALELYVRSLYWVLGNLTAAPVDPDLSPRSHTERTFTLCLIFFSLLVLGAGISSMTNTIAELSKLNSDFIETKRQLQSFLKAAGVHRELSTRIIQFALHSYMRRCALSLDAGVLGLLSERLKSELAVNQRSRYFLVHPLFGAVRDNYPEVFRDICESFTPNVYADGDVIFNSGRVAKCMYVTHQGSFRMQFRYKETATHLTSSENGSWSPLWATRSGGLSPEISTVEDFLLAESEWICEISLYTKYVHQCTLQSVSFADAFTFSCQDLLNCLSMSPRCVGFVYRYAQEYVVTAPRIHKEHSTLPLELQSLKAAREAFETMQKATQPLTTELESPDADFDDTQGFLQQLKSDTCGVSEMSEALPRVFKELDETSGLFAKLLQMDERNRAICSMLSIIMLVKNQYDDFVEPQSLARRLSLTTWQEWQSFVEWVDVTDEQLHAALVFLAIRGLGKMKSLAKALPNDARSPEDIVRHLMDNVARIVPSVSQLSDEMKMLVQDALLASKYFSLPQFLQGENTPSQIQLLQNSMSSQGEVLLKFLLLCQVGVMCGIMGPRVQQGSAFMDETNSTNIIAAIKFLHMAGSSSSHAVYWGYMLSRGQHLGLPVVELEQIALCRLACLCRASPRETAGLQAAWNGLSLGVRRTLRDNLLADGIQETAFVFTFLPLYLANSKANAAVGLQRALLVLVDLLEVLRAEGCAEEAGSYNIVVDLQEVAAFAKDVANPRVFQSTSSHVKLVQHDSEVQILVATKHKERMKLGTWAEDQEFDMPSVLRKLERKVDLVESYLADPGILVQHESYCAVEDSETEDTITSV